MFITSLRRSRYQIAFLSALLPAIAAFGQQGPLSVASRLPDNNAKSVCADTLLSITFNRAPTLGTKGEIRIYDAADDKLVDTLDVSKVVNDQTYTIGTIAFHAYPVMINGNTATIHPHNNLLTYGKTYYVQIDSGVLTDGTAPFAGYPDGKNWVFTTKAAPPATTVDKVTIAADGTGDFATIQGGIDFIPANNDHRIVLFLKNGAFQEIVSIVGKNNVTILGEDRAKTILSYPNNEKVQFGSGSSNRRGVVDVLRSTGVAISNMTINNATPKGTGGGWQAEAIISKSNSQIMITKVNLHSFQDTLQVSSPGYVADCYIEGDVDFMWGIGPCFFQDCSFKSLNNNTAFVVSRNANNHGFVYLNCKFDTAPGVTGSPLANNQNYASSEVVLLNCAISPDIDPTGWRGTGANVHYWEFNSTNIRDGSPADVSKRAAVSKRLDKDADAETIKNYSDPSFVLGGWKPDRAAAGIK